MEWIQKAENVTASDMDADLQCLVVICIKTYNCKVNYPDPCSSKSYPVNI